MMLQSEYPESTSLVTGSPEARSLKLVTSVLNPLALATTLSEEEVWYVKPATAFSL